MSPEGSRFPDPFDDLLRQADDLSDADLEKFLAGDAADEPVKDDIESTEPGSRVEGVVVDIRSGEVLVELSGKKPEYRLLDDAELMLTIFAANPT